MFVKAKIRSYFFERLAPLATPFYKGYQGRQKHTELLLAFPGDRSSLHLRSKPQQVTCKLNFSFTNSPLVTKIDTAPQTTSGRFKEYRKQKQSHGGYRSCKLPYGLHELILAITGRNTCHIFLCFFIAYDFKFAIRFFNAFVGAETTTNTSY